MMLVYCLLVNILTFWGIVTCQVQPEASSWCMESRTGEWREATGLGCYFVYEYTVDSNWNLLEFKRESGVQDGMISKSIAFGLIETTSALYSARRLSNGYLQFNFTVRNNIAKDSGHVVEASIIGGYESIIAAPGDDRCNLYEPAGVRKTVKAHQGGTQSDHVLWHCNAKQACINGLTSDGVKFAGCADSCTSASLGESQLTADQEHYCPTQCFGSRDVGGKYDFLQICRPGDCDDECGSEFGDVDRDLSSTDSPTDPPAPTNPPTNPPTDPPTRPPTTTTTITQTAAPTPAEEVPVEVEPTDPPPVTEATGPETEPTKEKMDDSSEAEKQSEPKEEEDDEDNSSNRMGGVDHVMATIVSFSLCLFFFR